MTLNPIHSAEPSAAYRRFGGWGCLLAVLFFLSPSHGEGLQREGDTPTQFAHLPGDSAALHEGAREAQRSFEQFHRNHLSRTHDDGGGSCDEWVGRICLRWSGGLGWSLAREDSVVMAAREELLATLAEVGVAIPGDRWVLGQRIRYLGHVGRWEEALRLSRGCSGGEAWWCPALVGYVLHRSGRSQEAVEAFEGAFQEMEAGGADEWWDPSELLDYGPARWVRDPDGLTREQALGRFWRLADPLFLTPGNERLAEHFSRIFGILLYEDAAITLGVPWGESLEKLLLRYGFTAGWERSWPRMNEVSGGSVVEHHHPESRGLLPPLEALEDPSGLPRGVWMPEDDRPRSASAPVRAPLLVEGRGQTAVFRREGDLLVIGAYAPPRDTLLGQLRGSPAMDGRDGGRSPQPVPWEPSALGASADTLAGLFLLSDTGSWAPFGQLTSGGEGVLQVRVPPGGYLLSLEQWNPAGRWGARVRHGVLGEALPPDVPALSDLVLLSQGPSLPEALPEALPRMKPGDDLKGDEPLTVAWEVYGLGLRREPLTFHLRLLEEEGSLIRRALKRIGLFNRPPVLTLSWTEPGADALGPLFRAVDLELPPLDDGRYVLSLEMEIPNRNKVVSHRRIRVF